MISTNYKFLLCLYRTTTGDQSYSSVKTEYGKMAAFTQKPDQETKKPETETKRATFQG